MPFEEMSWCRKILEQFLQQIFAKQMLMKQIFVKQMLAKANDFKNKWL